MDKANSAGMAKIGAILDTGSFVEIGAYMKKTGADTPLSGIITGYGAIEGRLVYIFVQNFDNTKGAMDEVQASKIEALYKLALSAGAPVIGVFNSAGAAIEEGALAMSAYGRVLKTVTAASGVIPQIAYVAGLCGGLSAVIASVFDFVVTVKDKSKFYVTSPFLLDDKNGSAEYAARCGVSSFTMETEDMADGFVRKLLGYLPSNNADGTEQRQTGDDVDRTLNLAEYTDRTLLNALVDNGTFLEVSASFGRELCVGLAAIGQEVCGVVACDSAVNHAALTPDAMRKASKFISFCDSFNIPLLTLVDSIGLVQTLSAEEDPAASAAGRLAQVYACSQNPKVTVIVGKAYGAAFTLLGSKALGSDLVFATENACISALPPETAVAFLWNNRISADVTREELEKKWKKEKTTAREAAACGAVDDIVPLAELRQRICAGFYMLARKSTLSPERRHVNYPL